LRSKEFESHESDKEGFQSATGLAQAAAQLVTSCGLVP
jgi:hypothetical protein